MFYEFCFVTLIVIIIIIIIIIHSTVLLSIFPDKLYVVNHALANGGSTVIVFNVIEKGSIYDSTCSGEVSNVRLQYVRTVQSPLFLNLAPNDVVEGFVDKETSEIYVTQWLQYAAAIGGKTNPKGFKEILHFVGSCFECVYSCS
jgi:hypothetical protein